MLLSGSLSSLPRRRNWPALARFLFVLVAGILSGTLLTTARAKPTLSFQLSQIPGFTHIVERRLMDAMKSYSERRLDVESLRMIYFHDQTVAVVELGPAKRLIGCELIEIYNDADGVELLRNLSTINRPLEISFRDMIKLMEQCEQVDRLNERNNYRATEAPEGSGVGPIAYRIGPDAGEPNGSYQADQPAAGADDSGSGGGAGGFLAMIMKNRSSKRGIFQSGSFSLLSGIIPGTKWCGTGDIAESYHDLGDDATMDRCCRTHDLCPMKVRAYQKRYNLSNNSIYTKSHCKCDDMLYECLKATNTSAAQVMGSIYFNLVQVPCLEDTPKGAQFRKAREGF
ncbi:AGAP000899-PA-like protein [Anopheles sinensis]|uniref:Phospholipase A2 n=1 Tax=Anopheles sinensis TaxID=74873 RepID=A0A084WFR7_ANOSI|nr:AGAP000899-PA-like protein [Anopheles sinensis]